MLIGRRGPLFNATCSMMARRKNSQTALLKLNTGERSKLNLFSTALTPGYAFGVLIIVVCAFFYVPQGALVPSLLVAAVASLLSGTWTAYVFCEIVVVVVVVVSALSASSLSSLSVKAQSKDTPELSQGNASGIARRYCVFFSSL